jgi:ATP-dependent RNA helicase SUPV3L1/SUV3
VIASDSGSESASQDNAITGTAAALGPITADNDEPKDLAEETNKADIDRAENDSAAAVAEAPELISTGSTLETHAEFLPDRVLPDPILEASQLAAADETVVPLVPEPTGSNITETETEVEIRAETLPPVVADAPETADTAQDAGSAVPAPELVEVWRPGGRPEERRPRHERNRHRQPELRSPGVAATTTPAIETGEVAKGERHRRGRRDRHRQVSTPATEGVAQGLASTPEITPSREMRDAKSERPREPLRTRDGEKRDGAASNHRPFSGGRDKAGRDAGGRDPAGRDKGGRDKGSRDKPGRDKRPEGGPSHRPFATSAPPRERERERPIDPNSPFAKLAALKEQLTANRKDR